MPAFFGLDELAKALWGHQDNNNNNDNDNDNDNMNKGDNRKKKYNEQQQQQQTQQQRQDMLVIGAGIARTGTTSLKAALERLGLKSYHMKHAVFEDVDLWYEHSLEKIQGKRGIFHSKIIPSLAQQGYNATVDNPNCLHYQELMEHYPNAKVILTLRVDDDIDDMDSTVGGESYAKSALQTVVPLIKLYKRVPYKWFSLIQKMDVMNDWISNIEYGIVMNPETDLPNFDDMATSYTKWVKTVRQTVPSNKLLLYKPTDGWKPLCDFLTTTTTTTTFPESALLQITRNCQQVLENNEPYPYMNDTRDMQNIYKILNWIAIGFENSPIIIIILVAVLMLSWKTIQIKRQMMQKTSPMKRQIVMERDNATKFGSKEKMT